MPVDQLPTIIPPRPLATTTQTPMWCRSSSPAPATRQAGATSNPSPPTSATPNTRRAYARACALFFAWCEARQLELTTIRSVHVASWVKQLQEKHSAPGVKQQLAAVRMLFDWLITGQVVPTNPAAGRARPKACRENRCSMLPSGAS